ncbi:hypothetical protein WBG99_10625 [Streptomyces sp. TG1A-60]|uniref:hypothetical protein n=1 Tax=Streptomyces sp. TG1A-60 TaxID=3129111 RepID=UPI0030CED334
MMNFEFDADTEEMRAMVVTFAQRELSDRSEPAAHGFDADDFRRRWLLAGTQGLVGVSSPPSTEAAAWTP